MISDSAECFVWIWLPGAIRPVVAGRLSRDGDRLNFNYGRSYLGRKDAIPIYLPELPLQVGLQVPRGGLTLASCLRDGSPDAWGRRVIINRRLGAKRDGIDTDTLDELTYLLESGSDRAGALDFQASSTVYQPRSFEAATLEQLAAAAARVEAGEPVPPALDTALFHGSSIGGARPKAQIETPNAKYVAKFSSAQDSFNVVKAEFVAMRLAAHVGLDVAEVSLDRAADRDVLLVNRFDRSKARGGWTRKAMVSALTLLELDDMTARYASYEDLAEIIRLRFDAPLDGLRELFGRMVFNIICGNTDDHARNHSAFWDGRTLRLTPAYDICPQGRAGNLAGQAMLIAGNRNSSQLALCVEAASAFRLTANEAADLIAEQLAATIAAFAEVAKEADLSSADRQMLATRQFLNASIFDGAPEAIRVFSGAML